MKASAVFRKKIEQMKKEMKGEVDQTKKILDRVASEHVTFIQKQTKNTTHFLV